MTIRRNNGSFYYCAHCMAERIMNLGESGESFTVRSTENSHYCDRCGSNGANNRIDYTPEQMKKLEKLFPNEGNV